MSPTETVYAFAPLLLALAILLVFKRKRRETANYAESAAVKSALPTWVKNVELLIFVMFFAMINIGTFNIFFIILGHSLGSANLKGASAVYLFLGFGSIGIPVAFLCAILSARSCRFSVKKTREHFAVTKFHLKAQT